MKKETCGNTWTRGCSPNADECSLKPPFLKSSPTANKQILIYMSKEHHQASHHEYGCWNCSLFILDEYGLDYKWAQQRAHIVFIMEHSCSAERFPNICSHTKSGGYHVKRGSHVSTCLKERGANNFEWELEVKKNAIIQCDYVLWGM